MKTLFAAAVAVALTAAVSAAADAPKGEKKVTGPLDFKMTGIDGKEVDLSKYKGKVVLLEKSLTSKETNPKFGGDEVKWNFEKFLVGRNGEIIGRYKSNVEPESDELIKAITTELEKK